MRLVLALAILLTATQTLHATPMQSSLEEVLDRSQTIVLARFVSPPDPNKVTSYQLIVEKTFRGTAKPGPLTVKASPSDHASFQNGTRLVAFIDAESRWVACGAPIVGTVEGGVLRLSGFDAYFVTPGMVTLTQLEGFVRTGKPIQWTFTGPILVGSPAGLVASTLTVTAGMPEGGVVGPPAVDFAGPTVEVGRWDDNDVIVSWSRITTYRPFSLHGAVTGQNPDGTIAVQYKLTDPPILTESDLRGYLADPQLVQTYYLLEIQKASTKIPVVIGRGDGFGKLGATVIWSLSMVPDRSIQAGHVLVTLAATGFKAKSHDAVGVLIEELMTGPIKCTYAAKGASVPCALRYVATKFTRR